MKLRKSLFLIITGVFLIALVACNNDNGAQEEGTAMSQFEHNFPASDMTTYYIEGSHHFYDVTMFEALALLEDPNFNGVFYFGFAECPWCQAGVPPLHEAALEAGVPVFYVSRRHPLREGDWLEADKQMAWWLYENGADMRWLYYDENGEETTQETDERARPNIFVPHIVHIRAGQIISEHRGTFEGHDAREHDLTPEEFETLKNIYLAILRGVTEPVACPGPSAADEETPECD